VKLLQNWSPEALHLLFLIWLEKSLEIFLKEASGRSYVFSKRQSSLNNKFSDRNQTLQAEAISNIVRIA